MFYVYNLFFFIYLCAVLTNNEQYKKSNNNANMEQPFNLVSNTTLKKNVAESYREGYMVYRLFCTT